MNKKPQENWESVFEQLPLDAAPRDEHRAELKERLLAAFDENAKVNLSDNARQREESPGEEGGLRKVGRIFMTYKAHYWTAAAVLVGLFVWQGQGTNTAFAFEEVIRNIANCRTARFDAVTMVDGKAQLTAKEFYMAPGKTRSETGGGAMTMIHGSDRVLILNKEAKEATVVSSGTAGVPEGANLFEMFRDALQPDSDLFKVQPLDERKTDGRNLFGFQVDVAAGVGRDVSFIVWADPSTKFPVEIEMTMPGEEDKLVFKNYEFDVELDEELFSTEIPAGYRRIDVNVGGDDPSQPNGLAHATEEAFIAGLKQFATTTGKLPSGVDPLSLTDDLDEYLEGSEIPRDKMQQVMIDLMMPVILFPGTLTAYPESGVDYNAEGAKAGDGTRPIFWYKPDGEENYRVIYADYSVKESAEAPVIE